MKMMEFFIDSQVLSDLQVRMQAGSRWKENLSQEIEFTHRRLSLQRVITGSNPFLFFQNRLHAVKSVFIKLLIAFNLILSRDV